MKDFLKTAAVAEWEGGGREGGKIPTEQEEGQRGPQGATVIPFTSGAKLEMLDIHPPTTAHDTIFSATFSIH